MSHRLAGVDVGGTFTDLLYLDDASGEVRIAKVPTTTENQAFGVLEALDRAGVDLAALDLLVHGTTTTTNALLERKLAPTGLITTRGFRDVLELGRRTRPKPYGLTGWFEPLIPRELRLEVAERMDAEGRVVVPLDEEAVARTAHELLARGCESVVIHFLHAYRNPEHERRAKRIVTALWPNEYITAGHEILSEYREYERGTAAAVNACVQPILARYLSRLVEELAARSYRRDVLVMRGNGGTVSARAAADSAVNTVMSGPASGVIAAARTAAEAGFENVITCDMGGTSCDVGLIRDGVPAVSSELEVEYAVPIHVPMVDVHSIGAGGGSIAFVNEAGLVQVGPESAGASPGPICFGRGGERVTITDANLLLGRLNPRTLLSVERPVPLDAIVTRFEVQIGAVLGIGAEEAAAAVLRIANDRMAGALRMVSLARGHDPRDFALFAFGGAGPLHAAELAQELGIPKVIVPARPGITNALGCMVADLRHDYVRTVNTPLAALDVETVHEILAGQIRHGSEMLARERVPFDSVRVIHAADMQFQGQSHLLGVPLTTATPALDELQALFERAYWERFEGRASGDPCGTGEPAHGGARAPPRHHARGAGRRGRREGRGREIQGCASGRQARRRARSRKAGECTSDGRARRRTRGWTAGGRDTCCIPGRRARREGRSRITGKWSTRAAAPKGTAPAGRPWSGATSCSRTGATRPRSSGANPSAQATPWRDRRSSSSSIRQPCCRPAFAPPSMTPAT